jgi:hypothetical protein
MGDLSYTDALRRSWDRITVELRVGLPEVTHVFRRLRRAGMGRRAVKLPTGVISRRTDPAVPLCARSISTVGPDPGGRSILPARSARSVDHAPKRCPQFGLGVIVRGATKNGRTVGGHAQHDS